MQHNAVDKQFYEVVKGLTLEGGIRTGGSITEEMPKVS
jgi:hypothetical protein